MKSLCIKTNDSNLLNYLLNELKYIDLPDIRFSNNQFKNYKNVIIHYIGNNNKLFFSKISNLLSFLVIDEFEEDLLQRILIQNYFYFDANERNKILALCFDIFSEDFSLVFDKKLCALYDCFYETICCNKNLYLTGFINFRLKKYLNILDEVVNQAVNSFLIEKEYLEFISLLKLYVNSQKNNCDIVHIIYSQQESILLDENKNEINLNDNITSAKFLSDISFSSNDYTLNSLLTLLPKKIYIHLINNCIDEFINTIQLVFENRVNICTDCNICKFHKNILHSKNI